MPTSKAAAIKLIPIGTKVQWKAQAHDACPMNKGIVIQFVPKRKRLSKTVCSAKVLPQSCFDRYLVKTADGSFFCPVAGRLHKFNPKALKRVK